MTAVLIILAIAAGVALVGWIAKERNGAGAFGDSVEEPDSSSHFPGDHSGSGSDHGGFDGGGGGD